MPCLLPTSASTVRPKVLPVDRVASNGLEDNSLDGSGIMSLAAIANDILVAFNEATPPLIEAQSSQQRELRAAANKLTIVASGCINPGHEATHPAPSSPGRAPVEMVAVVAARVVPLGTQALYPDLIPPALECPGAGLDAPHPVRTRDKRNL